MVNKINMVFNFERWNGISKTRQFREVCAGYNNEEDFWNLKEPIPNLKSDMIFLDVGCGPGRVAGHVAPLVKEYYGVDIHPELIGIAEEHYAGRPNIHFVKNDGRDLGMFGDDIFDYVYERLMFIHVVKERIITYFEEMTRVLKLGGHLYVPDLPCFEYYVNGLTRQEVAYLLRDFDTIDVKQERKTFQLECVK